MRWSWFPFLLLCCFHIFWSCLFSVGENDMQQIKMDSVESSLMPSPVLNEGSITLADRTIDESTISISLLPDSDVKTEQLTSSAVVDFTLESNKESHLSVELDSHVDIKNSNEESSVAADVDETILPKHSEKVADVSSPSADSQTRVADTSAKFVPSPPAGKLLTPDVRKLSVIMGSLADADASSMSSLPEHESISDEDTAAVAASLHVSQATLSTFPSMDAKLSVIESSSNETSAAVVNDGANVSIKLPLDNEVPVLVPPVAEFPSGKEGITVENTPPPSDSENMPSFKEWTEKRLAEQEKTGGNGPSTASVQGKISSVPKMRQKNYASSDCGAKIIGTNPEARTSSAILNSLHDDYMLNPCTAKIWFVIELCEPIQARKIDVANFELFSSSPKEFSVYSSDRYPSRDWVLLGTYVAKDEKTIQSFPLEQQSFHKYLKLEMSSHYGSEHYCPLSLVRAYGTSELEVLDTEIESEPERLGSQDPEDEGIQIIDGEFPDGSNTQSLLGSAKDAVLSIVKIAREAFSGDKMQGTQIANDSFLNDSMLFSNFTEEGSGKSSSDLCISLRSSQHNGPLDIFKTDNSSYIKSVEKVLSCDFTALNNLLKLTIIREILLHCSLQLDKNISYSDRSPYETRRACQYLKALLGPIRYTALRFLYKLKEHIPHPASDSVSYPNCTESSLLPDKGLTEKSMYIPTVISVEPALDVRGTSVTSEMISDLPSESTLFNISKIPQTKMSSELESLSTTSSNRSLKEQIHPTKTLKSEEQALDVGMNNSTVLGKDERSSIDFPKKVELSSLDISSSEKPKDSLEDTTILESSLLSTLKTKVTSVEESSANDDLPPLSTVDSTGMDQLGGDSLSSVSESMSCIGDHCVFTDSLFMEISESGGQMSNHVPSQPATSSSSSGTAAANKSIIPPSVQKESVFVRLSNRIKALELNMSLSSQYLEELSQRYRKQMEEMQRAFNKTIAALNDTAKKAHERDLKQQESINSLNTQIGDLVKAVEMLQNERESIGIEVIERHVFLIFLELFIAVVVFIMCKRQTTVSMTSPRFPSASIVPGNEASNSELSSDQSAIKRRNSFAGATEAEFTISKDKRRASEETLDKSGSYSDLMIVEPTIPTLVEQPPLKSETKRKRQKMKKMRRSLSNQNLGNEQQRQVHNRYACQSASSNSTKVTVAGLLFSSDQKECGGDLKVAAAADSLPPLPPKISREPGKCTLDHSSFQKDIKRVESRTIPELISHSSNGHIKSVLEDKRTCTMQRNGCITPTKLHTNKDDTKEVFSIRRIFQKLYSFFK